MMTTVTDRQTRRKGESRTIPIPGTCASNTSFIHSIQAFRSVDQRVPADTL